MFSPNPLVLTVTEGSPFDFQVVLYQASGGQLLFLNEDSDPGFFGTFEQLQGPWDYAAVAGLVSGHHSAQPQGIPKH